MNDLFRTREHKAEYPEDSGVRDGRTRCQGDRQENGNCLEIIK